MTVLRLGDSSPCVFLGIHKRFVMIGTDMKMMLPSEAGRNSGGIGPLWYVGISYYF